MVACLPDSNPDLALPFGAQIPSDKCATVLSFALTVWTFGIVLFNPLTGPMADRSLTLALGMIGGLLKLVPLFSRLEEKHLEHSAAGT